MSKKKKECLNCDDEYWEGRNRGKKDGFWDGIGFGIFIGAVGLLMILVMLSMGKVEIEYGTLNQICADYQGENYMFDKMRRIQDNPDRIQCKLRPEYQVPEYDTITILKQNGN